MHDSVRPHHLTRIRVQLAIYFCLHRGSLPENSAERQPRVRGGKTLLKNSVENYMSDKIDEGRRLHRPVKRCGGHERKMSHSLAARRQKDRGESQRLRFLALSPR